MGRRVMAGVAALALAATWTVDAQARERHPHLVKVLCMPASSKACRKGAKAAIGKRVQLAGRWLYKGMRVSFRWRRGAIATRLTVSKRRWVVRVPAGTATGRVKVRVRSRHYYSNYVRMRVTAPRHVTVPAVNGVPAAFNGNGMWIWQLPQAEGGNAAAIAARARATGISTVFVKSADGTHAWSQFNPALVQALHAAGLRVCAWQYVYGSNPVAEAQLGARAAAQGADCLVIDAETEYEGRYAAAQTYIETLRAAVGTTYPVGLTSFPYVDYHPGLPFSVFLGPGGAQVNVPQVYWKTIGGTVDAVSAHTYAHNRIYRVPMAPLGQAYDSPRPSDLTRFRQVWAGYVSAGLSWWDWQHSTATTWTALAAPDPLAVALPDPGWPALHKGSRGDEVVWLQEHLASAYPTLTVDGRFGGQTDSSLRAFQAAHGIATSGVTDPATWQAVLQLPLRAVSWTAHASRRASAARAGGGSARAPRSASLPARRYEIPSLGRGRP